MAAVEAAAKTEAVEVAVNGGGGGKWWISTSPQNNTTKRNNNWVNHSPFLDALEHHPLTRTRTLNLILYPARKTNMTDDESDLSLTPNEQVRSDSTKLIR